MEKEYCPVCGKEWGGDSNQCSFCGFIKISDPVIPPEPLIPEEPDQQKMQPRTRYCSYCGNPISADDHFCLRCGNNLLRSDTLGFDMQKHSMQDAAQMPGLEFFELDDDSVWGDADHDLTARDSFDKNEDPFKKPFGREEDFDKFSSAQYMPPRREDDFEKHPMAYNRPPSGPGIVGIILAVILLLLIAIIVLLVIR